MLYQYCVDFDLMNCFYIDINWASLSIGLVQLIDTCYNLEGPFREEILSDFFI